MKVSPEIEYSFAVVAWPNQHYGIQMIPVAVRLTAQRFYSQEYQKLRPETFHDYVENPSEKELKILQYCEEISNEFLLKTFGTKKLKTIESIWEDANTVPFIKKHLEYRTSRILGICKELSVPVFLLKNPQGVMSAPAQFQSAEFTGTFHFSRREQGIAYRLKLHFQGKPLKFKEEDFLIISNDPSWIYAAGKFWFSDTLEALKLKPFLSKEEVFIPESKVVEYFRKFILPVIKKNQVEAEGFEIKQLYAEPHPVLIPALDPWSGKPGAELIFRYETALQSFEFPYHSAQEKMVQPRVSDSGTMDVLELKRNKEKEHEIASLLEEILQVPAKGAWFFHPAPPLLNDHAATLVLDWLTAQKEVLQDAGVHIQWSWDQKKFIPSNAHIQIKISEEENDWFDLQAKIQFGDFEVPFKKIAPYILRNERYFILPDGSFTLLPVEWFEKYRNLALFGKEENDFLRIRKFHMTVLPELPVSMQVKESPAVVSLQGIRAQLRDYQWEGIKWMYGNIMQGNGVCLADEMGLGKTLQTIALLQAIKENRPEETSDNNHTSGQQLNMFAGDIEGNIPVLNHPVLIVVPLSLVHNWQIEFRKFAPTFRIHKHGGIHRSQNKAILENAEIVITTYGTLRRDAELFQQVEWSFVILDEAHYIKNSRSITSKILKEIPMRYRLTLTGTPIENSLWDLWSLMNFINPGMLGNKPFFRENFMVPIQKHSAETSHRLQQLIKPFILRRSIMQVCKELPEMTEVARYCDMSQGQKTAYEEERARVRNFLMDKFREEGQMQNTGIILQSLMKLRQIANHPGLVEGMETLDSGKFKEVSRHLEDLIASGHKVLIFSQFVRHLELYARYLENCGYEYAMLTGEMNEKKRVEQIKKFHGQDHCKTFLISLKAGGTGLNLTAASHVILLDPWWNPAVEKQAISRAYRIGQEKNVIVYRFLTKGSVEEKIRNLQGRKSELASQMLEEEIPASFHPEELLELVD